MVTIAGRSAGRMIRHWHAITPRLSRQYSETTPKGFHQAAKSRNGSLPELVLLARGREKEIFTSLMGSAHGMTEAERWGNEIAGLFFQLHPPESVPASNPAPFPRRSRSRPGWMPWTAIAVQRYEGSGGGNAGGGGEIERCFPAPRQGDAVRVREAALWWLLSNRKDSTWKACNLDASLKGRGLYDPGEDWMASL